MPNERFMRHYYGASGYVKPREDRPMTKDHTGIHADSYEEGVAPICMHGGLRRQCETCDLADRLDEALARIAALEREGAQLTDEDLDDAARALWRALCEGDGEHSEALDLAIIKAHMARLKDDLPPCSRCAGTDSYDGDWFRLCRTCYDHAEALEHEVARLRGDR